MFMIVMGIYFTYLIASPPKDFGLNDPRRYYYDNVFYNEECRSTEADFNELDILKTLYYLGITKERARELFQEARANVDSGIYMHEMVGVSRCREETLQYYDMALNLLNNLTETSDMQQLKQESEERKRAHEERRNELLNED